MRYKPLPFTLAGLQQQPRTLGLNESVMDVKAEDALSIQEPIQSDGEIEALFMESIDITGSADALQLLAMA